MSRQFWPICEPAQMDYELLREAVLSSQSVQTITAARFARRGLAGLITWPSGETAYTSVVLGADRPPWTPHADPRDDALAAGYELILEAVIKENVSWRVQR